MVNIIIKDKLKTSIVMHCVNNIPSTKLHRFVYAITSNGRFIHSCTCMYMELPATKKILLCTPATIIITSRVPIHKSIRPTNEVIMMNNDEAYDEIMMKLG